MSPRREKIATRYVAARKRKQLPTSRRVLEDATAKKFDVDVVNEVISATQIASVCWLRTVNN